MATHPATDLWEVQGKRIDLPVTVEDARFAGALWRAPRSAVDSQLEPYGLTSAGFRGTGLAMLVCVVYPEEFVLGGYDEVGIGVLASGPGGPGLFVLELPVTGAFTREAGREIWGLPKWMMTSTADIGGSRSTMVMSDGDVPVMDATIRTGALSLPVAAAVEGQHLGPGRGRSAQGSTAARQDVDAVPRAARRPRTRNHDHVGRAPDGRSGPCTGDGRPAVRDVLRRATHRQLRRVTRRRRLSHPGGGRSR